MRAVPGLMCTRIPRQSQPDLAYIRHWNPLWWNLDDSATRWAESKRNKSGRISGLHWEQGTRIAMSDNGKEPDEAREPFRSRAESGEDRFLAEVIVEALRVGDRTAKDFIRHFSPAAIMSGLADQPTKRANILINTVGVREKIALRKSATSAGEDLQIALDEGETNEAAVVELFDPDDRVAYLERTALWKFVTEGQFWKPSDEHRERSKTLLAFLIDCGIANGLVTHEQVVVAATVDTMATRLPRKLLGEIIGAALSGGGPFTEQRLLERAPPAELVKHIQLDYLWNEVVVPRIAREHGFEPQSDEPPAGGTAPAGSEAGGTASEPSSEGPSAEASEGAGPVARRMDSQLPMSGWSDPPPAAPEAAQAEEPAAGATADQDATPAKSSPAAAKAGVKPSGRAPSSAVARDTTLRRLGRRQRQDQHAGKESASQNNP